MAVPLDGRTCAVVSAAALAALLCLRYGRSTSLSQMPAASSSCAPARRYPAELLAEVGKRSKAILYTVSNKTNDAFSVAGLTKYLRMKGIAVYEGATPEETIAVNAERLIDLLDRTNTEANRPTSLATRHVVQLQGIVYARLWALFPEMKDAYLQQPLDYGRNSRYGDKWKISCYLVVMENWKPRIEPHEPMVRCMSGVMDDCVKLFEQWYLKLKALRSTEISVMNAFVTRYQGQDPNENHLKKHIDGASVGGSVILALPTDDPCEGGKLHVWDSKPTKEFVYEMSPGDIMFLDNAVWHEAKPIYSGTRWALVVFLRIRNPVKV